MYLRYSSSSQDPQTIEVQRKKCMEYAKNNGLEVIREYKDEAKSGRNGNRDGLQEILKDAKTGEFNFVIVYNTDRFFRDAGEGINTVKQLSKMGVDLISTTEPFINNASGKFNRNMSFVTAQYYSDLYGEKITNGIASNASKFLSIGGQISFGYKTIDKVIYVDEEKAPYVKIIYEKYLNGDTIIDIARYLNDLGVKTNTNGTFNKNSLRTILKNKRYIGTYIFKGQETPNAIPRIIEDDLFYKVQEKMKKNQKAPATNKAKEPYILTGKAFCGYCKNMLFADGGNNKKKIYYKYYVCKTKKLEKKCNKKSTPKEVLEDIVVQETRKILTDKVVDSIVKEVVLLCEKDRDTTILNKLNKNLKDNMKKKDNLLDAIADCDMPSIRNDLYEKMKSIDKQILEIEQQISIEEKKHVKVTVQNVKYFLHRLKTGKITDISYRQKLVNTFVNKVFVFDDHILIYYNIREEPVEVDISTINKGLCSDKDLCSPPCGYKTNF